jgi:hypothetical protein
VIQAPVPARTAPTSLRELQEKLQAAIMNGDDDVLATLANGAHASRQTLLGVYRHGYTARLIDVLRNDYPLLCSYVGDDVFARWARAFVAAHPSQQRNVRWFGTRFPEFIETQKEASGRPELAEIAAIERSVSDAFDSIDAPVAGFADVAAHAPDEWRNLRFTLHPSLSLVSLATNAFHIWKALNENAQPPQAERLSCENCVAVWRAGTGPRVRLLSGEETMLLVEVRGGATFGTLCEMLAMCADADGAPARAAGYLQSWLTEEMLASVSLAAALRDARVAAVPSEPVRLRP